MIIIEKAKKEKRERDKKRNRIILKIGGKTFHLTQKEFIKLSRDVVKISFYLSSIDAIKKLNRR